MRRVGPGAAAHASPSPRRAWIEITCLMVGTCSTVGSPSPQRAWIEIPSLDRSSRTPPVALLTEGVDRNGWLGWLAVAWVMSPSSRRAWIEISIGALSWMETATSPSHRRAWIEIWDQSRCLRACGVALSSESAPKRLPSHHIQSSPLFKGAVLLCLCKRNAFDSAYAINLPLSAASFVVICALTCSFVGLADPFGCLRRDSVTYCLHAGQTHVLRRNNVSRLYPIDQGAKSTLSPP